MSKSKFKLHITYTTQQIVDSVKSEDYAPNFKGFTVLGENMFSEITKVFDRNKNLNFIKAANDINIDIPYEVCIVAKVGEAKLNLEKSICEGNFPLKTLTIEEALPELKKIHDILKTNASFCA
jgi:hypothetical protein